MRAQAVVVSRLVCLFVLDAGLFILDASKTKRSEYTRAVKAVAGLSGWTGLATRWATRGSLRLGADWIGTGQDGAGGSLQAARGAYGVWGQGQARYQPVSDRYETIVAIALRQ